MLLYNFACICFPWSMICLYSVCSLVGTIRVGSSVLYFLEFNNSAGDGRLWLNGVALYVSNAKSISSPSSMVFISDAFIVWTYLSAIPFNCGCRGDETLCSICHCFMKSLNSSKVYCGPPSDTITLGTPQVQRKLLSSLGSRLWQ